MSGQGRRAPQLLGDIAMETEDQKHAGHNLNDQRGSSEIAARSLAYSAFLAEMHASMQSMWTDMHAPPPSGDADIDFLQMMMPHHRGAIAMASLVLQHGRDPMVRGLAESIIGAQASEIESMAGRLRLLIDGSVLGDEFPSLSGNAGPPVQ